MPAISSRFSACPGATGVSWGEALAMITSRPAQAIGMGGEIGSLAPGRRADVVIWSGDPLEGIERRRSRSIIDGVRQPLETHQTRLLRTLPLPAAARLARGVPALASSFRAERSDRFVPSGAGPPLSRVNDGMTERSMTRKFFGTDGIRGADQ